MHAGDVAAGLLDHGDGVEPFDQVDEKLGTHVDAGSGRIVVDHDFQVGGVCDGREMLGEFAFGQRPVRHRQHHDRLRAVLRCSLCAAYRARGGEVADANDTRDSAGGGMYSRLGDPVPLVIVEVRAFAGATQRRDRVRSGLDEPVDEATQRCQVRAVVLVERRYRVGDDAVDVAHDGLPAVDAAESIASGWLISARRA